MKIMISLLTVAALMPFSLFADHHAQATHAPVEVWTCNLNEGKTLDDVRKVSEMVAKVTADAKIPTAQWIFTPFTGDMDSGRFMLMTGWTDFNSMGKGFHSFFVAGDGAEVLTEWEATATCATRNLLLVESTFNQMGG